MAGIREEKTVQLMFGICTCTPTIKLNSDWQIVDTSRKICVMDEITFFAVLY